MEENRAELTNMEKAKELFEYEMTAVLLNVKQTYGEMGREIGSEYLDMEVPKAEVDYTAPSVELKSIGYQAPGELTKPEFSAEGFKVTAPEIGAGTAAAYHAPDTEAFRASVDKKAFSAAAVPGTAELHYTAPAEKPDLSAVKAAAQAAAAGRSVSAEALISGAATAKTAPKPEIKVSAGEIAAPKAVEKLPPQQVAGGVSVIVPASSAASVPELPPAEKPQVKLADAAAELPAELSAYGIAPAGKPQVKAAVPQLGGSFAAPSIPKKGPSLPKYPEIPEKPDHSAYISEILESIKNEI